MKEKIIVSFTTWPKRDKFVPIMLESIHNQSMKPDKVIMWLSDEEYPNNAIPSHLKECIKNKYITDVFFTKNTFAHKRWEAHRKYIDSYIITVDDDIIYEKDFIKDLYTVSSKNRDKVTVWTTRYNEYDGIIRIDSDVFDRVNMKRNQILSGLTCFPPNLFPQESFNYCHLRDDYNIKSDDAWVRAWVVKKKLDVIGVYDIKDKKWKGIPGSRKYGNWEINKQINEKGVQKVVENFANALVLIDAVSEAKELWKNFDIYKCCNKNIKK